MTQEKQPEDLQAALDALDRLYNDALDSRDGYSKTPHEDAETIRAALTAHQEPACQHEIVDARNEVVKSGYICTKCHAIFGGVHNDKQPVNAEIDLDNARKVFENWLTGNGNYPHLKHKSFGGNYLHEEVAMKWDGFRAGYYTQPKQSAPVERIDRLKEAVEFRREIAEFGISRVENFYGMNKDKPEVSLDTILWIAANAYLALQGGE